MAINLLAQYAGQVDPVSPSYPLGTPRNVTVPGDGLGTPWEAAWLKDKEGFFQGLLDRASITESGSPDTATVSDYHDALEALFLTQAERVSNGGDIMETGNSLPGGYRKGGRIIWNSGVLMTTEPLSIRNQGNTADLILAASMQKDISGTWVVGTGNGGLPDGLTLAQGWYRRFIVSKPDGTTDLCWDTSATAANFFADANAIAAGYSDATLYKRYGYTEVNAGLTMTEHFNSAVDVNRYTWDVCFKEIDVTDPAIGTGSRTALAFPLSVPPQCLGLFNMFYDINGGAGGACLITTLSQADSAASSSLFTMRVEDSPHVANVRGEWEVDVSSQIFARLESGTTLDELDITTDGWIDPAIVP